MSDPFKRYAGVEFTNPDQAWDWLENSRHLSDVEKRRTATWVDQWEAQLGHEFVDRLKDTSQQIKELRQQNLKKIEEGQERTAEVEHGMATGRMTTRDGLKEITWLARQHRECLAVQDSLRQSAERWAVDADRTVDDHLQEQQRRFPVLKAATSRRLTDAYLRGEEESPFRGGS